MILHSKNCWLKTIQLAFTKKTFSFQRPIKRGVQWAPSPLFFRSHLFFYDPFEELQTGWTKVRLIINKAPLTYVYPNTIKTYLTPNRLLFGRQLLCYSNTTSTTFRNQTVLSSTTDKINYISNHFWHMWRHECVVNLCKTQQASKLNIKSQKIMSCLFMMKRCPDTFGELP